jgi:hypothetical protein
MLSGGVDFRHPKFNHDELLKLGFKFETGNEKYTTYTLTFQVSDYTLDLVLVWRRTCWWIWVFHNGLGCMFNSYTKNTPQGIPQDMFPLIESVVFQYTNDGY